MYAFGNVQALPLHKALVIFTSKSLLRDLLGMRARKTACKVNWRLSMIRTHGWHSCRLEWKCYSRFSSEHFHTWAIPIPSHPSER